MVYMIVSLFHKIVMGVAANRQHIYLPEVLCRSGRGRFCISLQLVCELELDIVLLLSFPLSMNGDPRQY